MDKKGMEAMMSAFGGAGKGMPSMTKDEEAKQEHKITEYITKMDDEIKDRFKAIKTLQSDVSKIDEEHSKEYRKLEIEFENKYKEIYAMRDQLVNGDTKDLKFDQALLCEEFDFVAVKMKDDDYAKLEVEPCDVKSIQNTPKGVSNFWLNAILKHPLGEQVSERDRPILGYLKNIELDLHAGEEQYGYDLMFNFISNSYFKETQIKRSLFMTDQNKTTADKLVCTAITWNDGCNPTIKKQKKKKKGKKVTVEVQQDSFFNLFKNIDPSEEEKDDDAAPKDGETAGKDDKKDKKGKKGDEEEDDEDEIGGLDDQLADATELGDQIKDDLVPLALEYYLGVIELEEMGDDDEDDDDSDDDDKKKKKPKKEGKKGGAGADQKDCKQQ